METFTFLDKLFQQALSEAFPGEIVDFQIEYPDPRFGDFSCNIALLLAKKIQQNPHDIAKTILQFLPSNDMIRECSVAGPGFINVWLNESWLLKQLQIILQEGKNFGRSTLGEGQKIIVEYSQPNIAKPLGVHHLLSTIIGQSISHISRELGYETISINHIGDWGTQFGKLIVAYQKWGDHSIVEKNPIDEFLKLYVRFHQEAENDPGLEDEARAAFRKLEADDPDLLKIWQWCVDVSLTEIQKTYDFLGGIHFDYVQGESFYRDKMQDVIDEGLQKRIFEVGEGGALVVHFPDEKFPPYLVQKSDGTTLYSTRDLATLKYRIQHFRPSKILYVVDTAQSLYFQQLFETFYRFSWGNCEPLHVSFGRMSFTDKKMSTRKGNIILLDEVLKEAVKRASIVVEEKNPSLPESEKRDIAHKVGVGAVKYSILAQNRSTEIIFDWNKMLALEGNSAPYLQYTCARYCSILRKAEGISWQSDFQDFSAPQERALTRELIKYPEILHRAHDSYRPNILCGYIYGLTQICNSFYTQCPVLKAETSALRDLRLSLIQATVFTLKNGLRLLGIETPERM